MHNQNESNDMLLNEAMHEIQDAPIPAGPSVDTIQATLNAIERTQHPIEKPAFLVRIGTTLLRHRLAACILVPLPIAAAIISLLIPSLPAARHTAALGAMIEQIRSATSVQFRITYAAADRPAMTQRVFSKGDRSRIEFENGPVVITDPAARRILTLMPDQKKAFFAPMPTDGGSDTDSQSTMLCFAKFKDLQAQPGAYRGKVRDNGRELSQFQTEQQGAQFDMLADPQTNLPVRVTMVVPLFELTVTMSEFVLDAELSDELFSLTPPAGYATTEQPDEGDGVIASDTESGQGVVQTKVTMSQEDFAEPVEQDVIEYLRALAEFHNGQFPSAAIFNDPMDDRTAGLRDRMHEASEAERQATAEAISRYFLKWHRSKAYFKQVLNTEPTYSGEGVKQGDAGRAILTWTAPGQQHARAVYGDLSVKDADPAPESQPVNNASDPAMDLSAPSEQDVINYLRHMAEQNGGVFPSAQECAAIMERRASEANTARNAVASEQSREELHDYAKYVLAQHRATKFLASVNAVQPTPVGRGTKLGDGQRPVFMWGLSDQKHIRVVYGDLKTRTLDLNGDTLASLTAYQTETTTKPAQPPPVSSPASERIPSRQPVPRDMPTQLQPGKLTELPWYGFNLADKPSQPGLLINTIYDDSPDNSPAIKAGLHAEDILTHINGNQVSSRWEANQLIKKSRPGDKVGLTVRRGPESMVVPLVVGHWPRHSKAVESVSAGK